MKALTPAQKRDLVRDGYVQLRAAVSRPLREAALREIHILLAASNQNHGEHRIAFDGNQWYTPHESAAITDLYEKSPLKSVAESLIGAGCLRAPREGFVYLRFPQQRPPSAIPRYHVDGVYSATTRASDAPINPMTLKMCVFLSDVPGANSGNFTVLPGSHRAVADHFRTHAPETVKQGLPALKLAAPRQLTGRAGDVVLCHGLLFHEGEQNLSPHVRYAVFINLEHMEHASRWMSTLTDLWDEWPGIRPVARTVDERRSPR